MMKKNKFLVALMVCLPVLISAFGDAVDTGYSMADLRRMYSSGDRTQWPKPHLDASVQKGFVDIEFYPLWNIRNQIPSVKKRLHWENYCFLMHGYRHRSSYPVRAVTIRSSVLVMVRA